MTTLKNSLFVFSLVLLASVFLSGLVTQAQDSDRVLTATAPAQGLSAVDVDGKVGSVLISTAAVNDVRIRVVVETKSSWSFWRGRTRGNAQGVDLRANRSGNTLSVTLAGDREHLEETWTLEVPESLAAKVKVDVGRIRVRGIRGGCDTSVDVGEIDIDVPEGNISAESDVGDVKVRTMTKSYGNVDVRTSIGDARVTIDGHKADRPREPGPGDRFTLRGSGKDQIRLRADVGSTQLMIGR